MKRLLLCFLALLLVFLSGCGGEKPVAPEAAPTDKLSVVVSFYAMEELAREIGGDAITLHTVIPSGEEPHDFQPKASDLSALSQADVFIINGCDLEEWAPKAIATAHNPKLRVVTASDGADIHYIEMKQVLPGQKEEKAADPHVWLSLKNAKVEARNMRDAFVAADPAHAAYYNKRYARFTGKADSLLAEYTRKFAAAQRHTFVTGHAAFSYMASDFNLTQLSLSNVFAAGEPSIHHLKNLADECRRDGLTTVFMEAGESPRIPNTLAREIGARVEVIETLEEGDGTETYLETMQKNLEKLYQSMI